MTAPLIGQYIVRTPISVVPDKCLVGYTNCSQTFFFIKSTIFVLALFGWENGDSWEIWVRAKHLDSKRHAPRTRTIVSKERVLNISASSRSFRRLLFRSELTLIAHQLANMSRVYIGRLSYRAREKDVERFFKGYGKILEVDLKNG